MIAYVNAYKKLIGMECECKTKIRSTRTKNLFKGSEMVASIDLVKEEPNRILLLQHAITLHNRQDVMTMRTLALIRSAGMFSS